MTRGADVWCTCNGELARAEYIHFQTSKVRYFRKHHGRFPGEVLRWLLLGNYAWQLGLEGAKWLVGHKRALRAERVAAYRQVLRSGLLSAKAPDSEPKIRD